MTSSKLEFPRCKDKSKIKQPSNVNMIIQIHYWTSPDDFNMLNRSTKSKKIGDIFLYCLGG